MFIWALRLLSRPPPGAGSFSLALCNRRAIFELLIGVQFYFTQETWLA